MVEVGFGFSLFILAFFLCFACVFFSFFFVGSEYMFLEGRGWVAGVGFRVVFFVGIFRFDNNICIFSWFGFYVIV